MRNLSYACVPSTSVTMLPRSCGRHVLGLLGVGSLGRRRTAGCVRGD